jgi:hypothetical protein
MSGLKRGDLIGYDPDIDQPEEGTVRLHAICLEDHRQGERTVRAFTEFGDEIDLPWAMVTDYAFAPAYDLPEKIEVKLDEMDPWDGDY